MSASVSESLVSSLAGEPRMMSAFIANDLPLSFLVCRPVLFSSPLICNRKYIITGMSGDCSLIEVALYERV
jgi:hypothetical protein